MTPYLKGQVLIFTILISVIYTYNINTKYVYEGLPIHVYRLY